MVSLLVVEKMPSVFYFGCGVVSSFDQKQVIFKLKIFRQKHVIVSVSIFFGPNSNMTWIDKLPTYVLVCVQVWNIDTLYIMILYCMLHPQ